MDSPKEIKRETPPVSPSSPKTPTVSTTEKKSIVSSSARQSSRSTRRGFRRSVLAVASVFDRSNDGDFGGDDLMDLSDVSSVDSDSDDDNNNDKKVGKMQKGDEPYDDNDQRQDGNNQSSSTSNGNQSGSQGQNQASGRQSSTSAPFSPRGATGGPNPNQTRDRFVPEKPVKETPASPAKAAGSQAAAAPAPAPATKDASTDNKPAEVDPLGPTPAAPYGYKIVKVKKPDGTIVKVKRPLKAEEAAKATPASPTSPVSPMSPTSPASRTTNRNTATTLVSATDQAALASPTQTVASPTSDRLPTTTAPGNGSTTTSAKQADLKSEFTVTEKEILADEEKGIPGSPTSSTTTQRKSIARHMSRIMQILTWTVMIVLPLLFIALGIWSICMNNKYAWDAYEPNPGTEPLSQAIKIGASLWPIIFAAILAQTLKAYAAWKVERGIPLVTLEQLISSNSVGGAVKQPFMLRTINWTSILLVILWALSPLAGQAILRMTYTSPFEPTTDLKLQWVDPYSVPYDRTEMTLSGLYEAQSVGRMQAMFRSLILGTESGQWGPTDPWNNLKIPYYWPLQDASDNETLGIKDGWVPVDWYDHEAYMSSLIGYPKFDQDSTDVSLTSYNYTLDTNYYTLNCSDPVRLAFNDTRFKNLNFHDFSTQRFRVKADANTNLTFSFSDVDDAHDGTNMTLAPGPTGVLHFGSWAEHPIIIDPNVTSSENLTDSDYYGSMWYTQCRYDQIFLSNKIGCTREDFEDKCKVLFQKKLDRTPKFPLAYNLPEFLESIGNDTAFNGPLDTEMYSWYPFFTAITSDTNYPEYPWDPSNFTTSLGNISGPNGRWLSISLGSMVNTASMLGTWHRMFLAANMTELKNSTFHEYNISEAPGIVYEMPYYIHQISVPWLVTLMFCSVVLLLAGIASAYLENRTIGPDFLGFANTAIKRSVKLPSGMNHLSARDRLNALTECEVLLQDVKPNAGMGKIALGVKDESSTYLTRGRDYR